MQHHGVVTHLAISLNFELFVVDNHKLILKTESGKQLIQQQETIIVNHRKSTISHRKSDQFKENAYTLESVPYLNFINNKDVQSRRQTE